MSWIDLRKEMHILMHGGNGSVPQAYWGVIRIFRRSVKTPNWIEGVDEAVNGPEYYYDDHIVKLISYPAAMVSKTEKTTGGLDGIAASFSEDKDTYIFAVEYNPVFSRIPSEKDVIFHIDKHESVSIPTPPLVATSRFKIVQVFPDYGDYGRIEMIYCIGVKSHGES